MLRNNLWVRIPEWKLTKESQIFDQITLELATAI